MKVLVLSQHFWPETFRINEVVESLRGCNCEVAVLTGQPNYPGGTILPGYCATGLGLQSHAGYTIHRVPLVPRGRGTALRLALNYLSFLSSASLFGAWLLRGKRFDVVFVYGTSPILQAIAGIVLKKIKRAQLVIWVQDLWPQSLEVTGFVRSPRLLGAVAGVVRWIYRHSDLLLVQSRAFVPTVGKIAGGTPVEFHPNPGELAFTRSQRAGEPALELGPGFNVVLAGNLGTVQALGTVLDAAELLQPLTEARFVLVGSGSRSIWLQQEIARRGLRNVSMAGRFAPDDMPGIMAQASALLVTLVRSPTMSQTVPSKVPAYLAAGRPIIASLDGEGAQVVEESGAGVACPAEDAQALAAAVRHLHAASPQKRQQMGESGRRYYQQHFEPEMLARRLADRLRQLIAQRSGAGAQE
ncbi:MAG: glycosyltransferase family 4 protein [Burkholderiales bacterium]